MKTVKQSYLLPFFIMALFIVMLISLMNANTAAAYDCGDVIAPNNVSLSTIEGYYNQWKSTYVTNQGAGEYLRVVRPENSSDTVSEGIAYGMLLAAYLDDQTTFNGLWEYAKSHFDANGVMKWQINSNNIAIGQDGATDAEEDMAIALIVADRTWGDYTQDANAMIESIMDHEVESGTWVLKNGDTWGGSDSTNPSYWAPGYYDVYRDYTGDTRWNNVTDASYDVMDRLNSQTGAGSTGLLPDWTTASGQSTTSTYDWQRFSYNYDAARVPWRLATHYAWSCDARAEAQLDLLNNFFCGIGASNIVDGYDLNGNPTGQWNNATFVGMAATGTIASSNSSCQDQMWQQTVDLSNGGYFSDALRMISLLFMSGNMPNPMEIGAVTPTPTNTNTPPPTNTNTPIPTNTNTPVPANTNTPIPANTNTPVPANTNTPVPNNPTNTPQPTATSSSGGGSGTTMSADPEWDDGNGAFSASTGCYSVDDAGTNIWDALYGVGGFSFDANTEYTVTFTASGDGEINVNVGSESPPTYVSYGSSGILNLTSSPQTFSFTFTPGSDLDNPSNVTYQVGGSSGAGTSCITNATISSGSGGTSPTQVPTNPTNTPQPVNTNTPRPTSTSSPSNPTNTPVTPVATTPPTIGGGELNMDIPEWGKAPESDPDEPGGGEYDSATGCFTVTDPQEEIYSALYGFGDFTLQADTTYSVQFEAMGDDGKTMVANLGDQDKPYPSFSFYNYDDPNPGEFTLTSGWQTFSFEFTTPSDLGVNNPGLSEDTTSNITFQVGGPDGATESCVRNITITGGNIGASGGTDPIDPQPTQQPAATNTPSSGGGQSTPSPTSTPTSGGGSSSPLAVGLSAGSAGNSTSLLLMIAFSIVVISGAWMFGRKQA